MSFLRSSIPTHDQHRLLRHRSTESVGCSHGQNPGQERRKGAACARTLKLSRVQIPRNAYDVQETLPHFHQEKLDLRLMSTLPDGVDSHASGLQDTSDEGWGKEPMTSPDFYPYLLMLCLQWLCMDVLCSLSRPRHPHAGISVSCYWTAVILLDTQTRAMR